MLRKIGGVIAGYVAMFLCIFALFTGAYLALGPDGSFQPGTYEVSGIWVVLSLVVSVVAAVLGGLVCKLIGGAKAPLGLAVLVVILGVVSAIFERQRVVPPVRAANVGNLEAMQNAKQPIWIHLLMPVIGAVGVLAGAPLKQEGR